MQPNVNLIPLDLKNESHLRLMFDTRCHPNVNRFLTGNPPVNYQAHIDYLNKASIQKQFFIITYNQTACGYCQATPSNENMELGWTLHPNWWNKGIGTIAISLLVEKFRYDKTLILYVKKDNSKAIHLYKKFGFKEVVNERNEIKMELTYDPFTLHCSPNLITDPEISVIVSTYNRHRPHGSCESLLKRALDSILNQTFQTFELILINDFSSDATEEYCLNLVKKDNRIKFYSYSVNSGLPAKRYNFGIAKSSGKFITFMFDDDVWEPTALEKLYEGIVNTKLGMAYGKCVYRNEKNDTIIHPSFGYNWNWWKIFRTNILCNNSVIIRRDVIKDTGGYDEDPVFIRNCDWDLWWRIGRLYQVKKIDHVIGTVYSLLPDSIGHLKHLDMKKCKKRQLLVNRPLPLKSFRPIPINFHTLSFDILRRINGFVSIFSFGYGFGHLVRSFYHRIILRFIFGMKRILVKKFKAVKQ